MKKNIKILLISISLFATIKVFSQTQAIEPNLYISPFITIGYTFNSGFNYGVDITFGLFKVQNYIPETTAGFSIQYYFVNYKESVHKITAFNLITENRNFRAGIGGAGISKKWGFRNRNLNRAFGTSIDLGITTPSYKTPWLAFKTFVPKQEWELCLNPYYISLYTYFKYEPIYLNPKQ